ncbi:hypothetical protein [Novosphingobium sp. HII-3]|uniref:hypothetical protein n=1 Tax=Novosphingobium sp. HII-3 TaxID=2075565 RepID=UPI001304A25E|nr:hypothetical protein [Novosphingobium sp. HII-3]
MQKIVLREVPRIAAIEQRLLGAEKLMSDELEALQADVDAASIELFGITQQDTLWPPKGQSYDEWMLHFEFLEWEYDEEAAFWDAFGIDVADADGEPLECLSEFGRQLVCVLKRLLPEARLRFRPEVPLTDEQIQADAEAWGRFLLASRRT